MTIQELKAAIGFGRDLIVEMDEFDKEIPAGVYERLFDLYEQLVAELEASIPPKSDRLKAIMKKQSKDEVEAAMEAQKNVQV